MFLPQLQQGSQEQKKEEKQSDIVIPEPPRLLRLKTVNRLSIYGFWFLLGVAIANLSRLLVAGWIIYWIVQLGLVGYLMFVPPDDVKEEEIATRRIAGFALFLSCFSFWDWVVVVISLPVHVLLWILPVWQCVALGIVGLMLLGVFIGLVSS